MLPAPLPTTTIGLCPKCNQSPPCFCRGGAIPSPVVAPKNKDDAILAVLNEIKDLLEKIYMEI